MMTSLMKPKMAGLVKQKVGELGVKKFKDAVYSSQTIFKQYIVHCIIDLSIGTW